MQEREPGARSSLSNPETLSVGPVRLALMLASGLMAVLVLINALGGGATPVDEDRFLELAQAGVVESIVIEGPVSLTAELRNAVNLREAGDPRAPEYVENQGGRAAGSVFVEFSQPISAAQREVWRSLGIFLREGEPGTSRRSGLWAAIVFGMLGLGIWHLIAQARNNLRFGSPRQLLKEVESQFREGLISSEERDRKVEEISARL